MSIPIVDFEKLLKDLKRVERSRQLTQTDDESFEPITEKMKSGLDDVARYFEVFSYDLYPDSEVKKFVELLRFLKTQID
ncbi:hypothetical protein [Bermanella sp. R86510]|uniref:hypothetical protein n=1 Tax=unclassified Bermanella TaxID=2627862 RepID=UPI0037C61DF6